jgi:hypothetical protein
MFYSSVTYALVKVPWGLALLTGVLGLGALIYQLTEK